MSSRAPPNPALCVSCARGGVTLTELLVSIVVITILLALLALCGSTVYEQYLDINCRSNLRYLSQVMRSEDSALLPDPRTWVACARRAGLKDMLRCPADDIDLDAEEEKERPVTGASNVSEISPPQSCVFNSLESATSISMFCEQECFVLPRDVSVDISTPGRYDSAAGMSGSTIPSGTLVSCYFLHYDPPGSTNCSTSGFVNFGAEILGIICTDGALNASDTVFATGDTAYPNGQRSRGFESGVDIVVVSEDRRRLTIERFQSTFPGEQCRVIIAADEGGGLSGYAMNGMAMGAQARAGQVLLIEYRKTLVDFDGYAEDDVFEEEIAPRHGGRVNVLFVDGNVESMAPEDLEPRRHPALWNPQRMGTGK